MIISSGDWFGATRRSPRRGVRGLPFPTSDTLQVLGCVDSRVDPGDVLGLKSAKVS